MKKILSVLLCAVLLMAFAACSKDTNKNDPETIKAAAEPTYPEGILRSDYEKWQQNRDENILTDEQFNAVNEFAVKTASAMMGEEDKNITYSPVSAYFALSLAACGAEGNTAEELMTLLEADSREELSERCARLFRLLYADGEESSLKIANSLWLSDKAVFEKDYISRAAQDFYSYLYNVDFTDAATADAMKEWVSRNTGGKLAPEFEFSDEELMRIINTVYYKDSWSMPFNEAGTETDTFYLLNGSTVECSFMNKTETSGFAVGEGFVKSALPLQNGGAMTFILPDEGVSPFELVSDSEKLASIINTADSEYGRVIYRIPKFSYQNETDLAEAIKKLGVSDAFDAERADFSGISELPSFISGIRQGTHIAVDEKGVEAAAFTDISMAGSAFTTDTCELILNRPFIFMITSYDGVILFTGICENPAT